MSGHSHWSSIKHKKSITDAKKSKFFSKMAREITLAAKEGGGSNPEFNSKLRLAIDRARSVNMPADNIEKAIKRGSGELGGETLEQVIFEAYGPNNIAIIIEGITDNKNRTLGEIKGILNRYNGKLVGEGAVRWMFEKKGWIGLDLTAQKEEFKNEEQMEMLAIECGALDIDSKENLLDIYTKPEELEMVKKAMEGKGAKIESASLDWVAKEMVRLDDSTKTKCEELFNALDELDSVQQVFSNLEN